MSHKLFAFVLGFAVVATTFASQADAQLLRGRGIFRPVGQYVSYRPTYTNYVWSEPVIVEQPMGYASTYNCCVAICCYDPCCCSGATSTFGSPIYDSSAEHMSTTQPHQVMKPAIDETGQPAAESPVFQAPATVPPTDDNQRPDDTDQSSEPRHDG